MNTLPFNLLIPIALLAIFAVLVVFLLRRSQNRTNGGPDRFDELYMKLSQEIKFAVAPKSLQLSVSANELVDLALEIWRMEQRLAKIASTLPENHRKGLENSVLKLKKYISNYDIEIVDYTDQKFNDGLNLDVLSVEKDPTVATPTVKETVEPTILIKGQVVRKAKIILLSN